MSLAFLRWRLFVLYVLPVYITPSESTVYPKLIPNSTKEFVTLQLSSRPADSVDTWGPIFLSKRSLKGVPEMGEVVPLGQHLTDLIKKQLNDASNINALNATVGESIEMDCDNKLTQEIMKVYTKATRRWVHNNYGLQFKADRMTYSYGHLAIRNVQKSDQGVYLCRIEYLPKQTKTVAFFALRIQSDAPDIFVQESQPLQVQCNSAALGFLFPAVRQWYKNGQMVNKLRSPAAETKSDIFENADKSFEGNWECVVTEPETGRVWITALYRVVVLDPPSTMDKILSKIYDNPIQTIFLILAFSALLTIIVIGIMLKAKKSKESKEKEFELLKESLKDAGDLEENASEKARLLNE